MPRPRSRVHYQEVNALSSVATVAPRVIPAVDPWLAAEMFVSQHVEERRRGFALLIGSENVRRSNLTPHLLILRLGESDVGLRAQIIQALADYFEIRGLEYRYPPEMRAAVAGHLRQFDRAEVLQLLEVHATPAECSDKLRPESLAHLVERIPNASTQLTRLAGDRTLAVALRRAAIEVVGLVGFTDAQAPLEGLEARIEGRRAGQLPMLFAPSDNLDDQQLLPVLKEALRGLRERD